MANLCIIPARHNSKRIPQKNIKLFFGKPILAYSIELAIKSKLFDEVMVSTDDDKIASISKQYGASIPFLRSKNNSDDFASTYDVLLEVLNQYQNNNQTYEYLCCLYATCPLLDVDSLIEGFRKLKKYDYDSVFPICEYKHPIQRALKYNNNKVSMFNNQFLNSRSQDLEKAFYDPGQFYWLDVEKLYFNDGLYSKNSGAIIIDESLVQDINDPEDWEITEKKYRLLHGLS